MCECYNFVCGRSGNISDSLRYTCIGMWFETEFKPKRHSCFSWILGCYIFVTFVGIPRRHHRTASYHPTNIICSIFFNYNLFIRARFLRFYSITISQWIFVSEFNSNIFDIRFNSLIIPYSIYQYLACLVLRELYTLIWVNFTTISKEVAP